jgi:ribosome biogenesis protein BRX1
MKNCNNCLFFEARKHQDLYLWAARAPQGPSIKFLVQNIHTMSEVKLTGNCLKGSRPVMHFDKSFADAPQSVLMRELLSQCFGSPKGHPKVKPFVDHIFSFFYINGRIWFRNYQIAYDANRGTEKEGEPVLVEIGPRFVLTPVKIFAGSFRGAVLWENKDYVSPNVKRAMLKRRHQATREVRAEAKRARSAHVEANPLHTDELEDVFL